jgi:hypothetical protein
MVKNETHFSYGSKLRDKKKYCENNKTINREERVGRREKRQGDCRAFACGVWLAMTAILRDGLGERRF